MHDCDKHFTMDLKQVKQKVAKTEKKVDANKMFDYSHKDGKPVKVAKKKKGTEDPNKMQMSFYNLRTKTYTRENK